MRKDTREFAGDGSVHHFHDVEVGGEEDVEVALMDLYLLSTCSLLWKGEGDLQEVCEQAPSASDTWSAQSAH